MADDSPSQNSQDDVDEHLGADYFVQSPDGNIYPADAQGRSDLVARGYTDITDFGGAEKFREQNEKAGQASAQSPDSDASTASQAEQSAPEAPARQTGAQGRRQPTNTTPGTPSQNPEDAGRASGTA